MNKQVVLSITGTRKMRGAEDRVNTPRVKKRYVLVAGRSGTPPVALGTNLSMHPGDMIKVRDLMTIRVETLQPEDDLDLAKALMRLDGSRHLPVVSNGDVVGMVSDRDVLRAQVSSLEGLTDDEMRVLNMRIKIADVMTREVETIDPDVSASEAAKRLRARRFSCLPVVERGELVGIVTASDFLDLVATMD